MSGICGIVKFDGATVTADEVTAMTEKLERRGPERTSHWLGGEAALGHTLLATTPEAVVERLPLFDAASGCAVTADVRLDNRDKLLLALGLDNSARKVGDGELLLRAYLKWGQDCPKHLLGDFAFAIWDPRTLSLFCARDHMGMRQLLYHHEPGQHFIFATEAQAVLAHASVPRRINERRIADFLDDVEGIKLPETFFAGICRLPPAHVLMVSSTGGSLRRYWELRAPPPLKLASDEEYANAFLEVLTEAVRCRLRIAGPVGSMLSGGMDSGSVAAVAARLLAANKRGPLQTFSAVGPEPSTCIETRTIMTTAELPNIAAHFVNHADLGEWQAALKELPVSGEPFDYHMTLIRAVYLSAHRHGVKVMLDGVAGDVVLTAGSRIGQLLRAGRIVAAIAEARAETRFWGRTWPWWKSMAHAAWAAWVPANLRKLRNKVRSRRARRASLVSPELRRLTSASRQGRSTPDYKSYFSVEQRRRSVLHPHLTAARERYDRVASANAIEPRDPFMDIRLIEFCLSLPAEQLQAGGWPKLVLRRATRDSLPDAVRWRIGKEHLGWAFTLALFDGWEGWSGDLQLAKQWIGRWVRAGMLSPGNKPHGKALDRQQQFRLFYLLTWLRQSGPKPPIAVSPSGKRYDKENA